jgi:hypothetical protein
MAQSEIPRSSYRDNSTRLRDLIEVCEDLEAAGDNMQALRDAVERVKAMTRSIQAELSGVIKPVEMHIHHAEPEVRYIPVPVESPMAMRERW